MLIYTSFTKESTWPILVLFCFSVSFALINPHILVWGKAKASRSIGMSKLRVTLNSKLTVVSSRPVSTGKVHKLSVLDRGMGSHTLHIIFYYKNEDNWFKSFELDPLRESLSEVLTFYPVVTGRLGRGEDGEWEVKCNDAGVRTIKATVDATLHEWLKSASDSEEKLLASWDDMPEDPSTWSPFRIQVLLFTILFRLCMYSSSQSVNR